MKKNVVVKVSLLVLTIALIAGGCATSGGGGDPKVAVQNTLDSWKAAIIANDVDKIMATISANFEHDGYDYQAKDKAALADFIDEADQMGYFDDVEIFFDNATITIEEDVANVIGIEYVIDQGTATIDLAITKEKGGWLIADMDIQGM